MTNKIFGGGSKLMGSYSGGPSAKAPVQRNGSTDQAVEMAKAHRSDFVPGTSHIHSSHEEVPLTQGQGNRRINSKLVSMTTKVFGGGSKQIVDSASGSPASKVADGVTKLTDGTSMAAAAANGADLG